MCKKEAYLKDPVYKHAHISSILELVLPLSYPSILFYHNRFYFVDLD